MFSMCHCWNKTPQGRGGCMRRRNWTPVTIAGNTRWKQFGTARSMRESQNQVIYQVSTIWSHGKDIQRKKIPGSQPQRSNTSESSSTRSTRIILTSRPRLLWLLTLYHRWLDQQSSPRSLPNESEDDQPTALTNKLKSELRLIFIVFLDEFGKFPSPTSLATLHVTTRDFQPTVLVKTSTSQLLYPLVIRRRFSSYNSPWVRRFFIDNLQQSPVFLLSLPSLGWEGCHQRYGPLRLISFPTGLGYSHSSPGILPQSNSLVGRFFIRFLFRIPHQTDGYTLNKACAYEGRQL